MAGLGRKVFEPLEFLSAAEVNGYLMDQSIMYFANATARNAAIPTPDAGMHTYRADGTVVEVYNGSAWVSANSVGGTITINATAVTNTLTSSTATAYTVAAADQSTTLRFTAGSAVTVTVGTATAFTAGQRVDILQDGAGTVTITAGSGVTLAGRGTAASSYTLSQYDAASLLCVSSNTYRVIGNVTAV